MSRDRIHNHAEHLIATLCADRRRREANQRPVVFVAYSLGGLVVKRALIHSSQIRGNKTEHLRSIFVSTYGILFLGTPHRGSDVASWGSRLAWICGAILPSKLIDTQPQLVDALKTNNETLQNIDRQFIQLASNFHIYFFHEGKPTNLHGIWQYIVDEESASPNIHDVERASIQQDHAHMCQFENESTPGFDLVAEGIQRYTAQAPEIIRLRWESESVERQARKEAGVKELLRGTITANAQVLLDNSVGQAIGQRPPASSQPPTQNTSLKSQQKPYYIVPRERVKDFVGREAQLRQISSHFLTGPRKQTQVLILHALGGQGKSQIVLEYCQRSREQYHGIFWVNASSEASAMRSYARIARALSGSSSPDVSDGDQTIRVVKDSLESWDESWLLVFDNYDEPNAFPKVQRFLPKRKCCAVN